MDETPDKDWRRDQSRGSTMGGATDSVGSVGALRAEVERLRGFVEAQAGEISALKAAAGLPRLLVGAEDVAAMAGVSESFWWKLKASGRCPAPVHLGGRTLWSTREIEDWSAAGCPARDAWESSKRMQAV